MHTLTMTTTRTRALAFLAALAVALITGAWPAQAATPHLHRAEAVAQVLQWRAALVLPSRAPLADCRRTARPDVRRCTFVGETYRVRVVEQAHGYLLTPVGVPALDVSL